jgi:hypothetical protein
MPGPKSVFDPPAPKVLERRGRKPNSIGRKGKFRLAAACAELMSDDDVAWWLREIMAGRDPDQKVDKETGLPIVPAGGFALAPSWKDRLRAAELFLNRRNGQAPQSVLVEQELHVRGKVDHVLSTTQIRDMVPERKAELRRILREAKSGAPALEPAPDPPVEVG